MRQVSLGISMGCLITGLLQLFIGDFASSFGWLSGFTGWGLLYIEEGKRI